MTKSTPAIAKFRLVVGFAFGLLGTFLPMASTWTFEAPPSFWALAGVLGVVTGLCALWVETGWRYRLSFFVATLSLFATLNATKNLNPETWWSVPRVTTASNVSSTSVSLELGAKVVAPEVSNPDYGMPLNTLAVFPNAIATLTAFRLHPICYMPLLVAVGWATAVAYESTVWGFLVAAFLALMVLIPLNYVIQFVRDHAWEADQFRRFGSRRGALRVIVRALAPWLVGASLAAAGAYGYWLGQQWFQMQFYSFGLVFQDPNRTTLDLEHDLTYTLERAEDITASRLWAKIDSSSQDANEMAKLAPGIVDDSFAQNVPATLPDTACGSIHWTVSFILRPACEEAIAGINSAVARTYARVRATIVGATTQRAQALALRNNQSRDEILAMSAAVTQQQFSAYAATARYAFSYLAIANLMSAVYLTASLLALFQWFVYRIVFHGETSPTFRLSGAIGGDEPIKWTPAQEINLNSYTHPIWYVIRHGVKLDGDGAAENIRMPQLWCAFVRRLFKRRLMMTMVTIMRENVKQPATLSCLNPESFVVIELRPGQRVVIQIGQIAAFSDGVKLRSTYSAHTSSNFLGLGRFITTVEGIGHVALLARGKVSDFSSKAAPEDLLAWDLRTPFSLDQATTGLGMWLNDARLSLRSENNSAIGHSSGKSTTSIGWKLGRLFRFVVVSW